jgi:hypothetical protein
MKRVGIDTVCTTWTTFDPPGAVELVGPEHFAGTNVESVTQDKVTVGVGTLGRLGLAFAPPVVELNAFTSVWTVAGVAPESVIA